VVTTAELIERLSAGATPVRRLRPPMRRAGLWLLFAAVVLVLLAVSHGVRPDLAARLGQPVFAAALAGSLLTGILATIAVFHLSVPGRSRLWLLLPVPALVLWVATIGYGCLTDWVSIAPGGLRLGSTLDCFLTLVLASLPPSVLLLAMLHHTAPVQPRMLSAMGGLAVAGIAATSMSILHALDATIMVLIWNLGAAAVIVALGGTIGRRLLARGRRARLDG
jgi:hypothetical protein